MPKKIFTADEAKHIGDQIGIDWSKVNPVTLPQGISSNGVNLEQFRMGLAVELEHGARDPETNVTNDDLIMTGKIALAHLNEFPDYYTRLEKLEKEAEEYWQNK